METVTNSSRKSSISLDPEYQRNGDPLANWSSTRHTSQKSDTMDRSFYFFRVLIQLHTKKEGHIKHLARSNHRVPKVTLAPLAHFRAFKPQQQCYPLPLAGSAPPSFLTAKAPGKPLPQPAPLRLKVLLLHRNQPSGTPKGKQFETIDEAEKRMWGDWCFTSTRVLLYLRSVSRERLKKQNWDRANTIKVFPGGAARQSGT